MKRINFFTTLRRFSCLLVALIAWFAVQPAWSQTEPDYLSFTATKGSTKIALRTPEFDSQNTTPNDIKLQYRIGTTGNWVDWTYTRSTQTTEVYTGATNYVDYVGEGNGEYEDSYGYGEYGYSHVNYFTYVGEGRGAYTRRYNKTNVTTYYYKTKNISLSKGQTVYIRAKQDNPAFSRNDIKFASKSKYDYKNVSPKNSDRLTGTYWYFNLYTDFSNKTSLDKDYAFAGLFNECYYLLSAPKLPATGLRKYCYFGMFFNCDELISAPSLPATTLVDHCYAYMFAGCHTLQTMDVAFTSWDENYTQNWAITTGHYVWEENDDASGLAWSNYVRTFPNVGLFTGPEALYSGDDFFGYWKVPYGWTITKLINDYLRFSWHGTFRRGRYTYVMGDGYEARIYLVNTAGNDNYEGYKPSLEWSTTAKANDWHTWNFLMNDYITLSGQSTVYLRARSNSGNKFISYDVPNSYFKFQIDLYYGGKRLNKNDYMGIIDVGGNIMSLLDKNCLRVDVPDYCFYGLFQNSVSIFGAPSLPGIELGKECYAYMFDGCKALNSAPHLLATSEQLTESGADGCYNGMFRNCENLAYLNVGFSDWTYTDGAATKAFTTKWVEGVATTRGTFVCPEPLEHVYSDSRIPTNWNNNSSSVGSIDEEHDWLCFEAESTTATVQLNRSTSSLNTLSGLQYSYTGQEGTWQTYEWAGVKGKEIAFNRKSGNYRVFFRSSTNNGQCSKSATEYYTFSTHGTVNCSGDARSLLQADCQVGSIPDYAFYCLFKDCGTLKSAPTLPATIVGERSYAYMFQDCKMLTYAPDLPATTLSNYSYLAMFDGCTMMLSVPEVAAKNLTKGCYFAMFRNCSSITSAPTLPATELDQDCYNHMFDGCTKLQYINVQFTNWWEGSDTATWVADVANSGIFACPMGDDGLDVSVFSPNRVPKNTTYKWTLMDNKNSVLYFEARRNGSTIQLNKVGSPSNAQLIYSLDDQVTWKDYSWDNDGKGTLITLNKVGNNRVYFKAKEMSSNSSGYDNSQFSNAESHYYNFSMKGVLNGYGSVFSLLSSNLIDTIPLPNYAFVNLFKKCNALRTAPELTGTSLGDYCYMQMFQECKSLETAPKLPASVTKNSCYSGMFMDCSKLKEAPELDSKTMAPFCYQNMFRNCISLEFAPQLPALRLSQRCYEKMFSGCTHLKYMNVGFSNWHTSATNLWVDNVPESGIFMCPEALPHSSDADFGSSRIPKDKDHRWIVNESAMNFTAEGATAKFGIFKIGDPKTTQGSSTTQENVVLKYSLDNALTWNDLVWNQYYSVQAGKSIYVKAYDKHYNTFSTSANDYYQVRIEGSMSVEGSVMALLDTDAAVKDLPDYCFYNLFTGGLLNTPKLPAKVIGKYAYANMFKGCNALTTLEDFTIDNLTEGCFSGMFENCSNLRNAPALGWETLAKNCYSRMFAGCRQLKIAPTLPATVLVEGCYNGMFDGCERLNEMEVAFSSWKSADNKDCTTGWVKNVSNSGSFSCPVALVPNVGAASTFGENRVPKDADNRWMVNPDYLTFKAIADEGGSVALDRIGTPDPTDTPVALIYSKGTRSNWQDYRWDESGNGTTLTLAKNEAVYFRAKDENLTFSKDADNYYHFDVTGTVTVSGYASYLLNRADKSVEVPAYGFYKLFAGNATLTTAPEVSPNLIANAHCYESMFEGCSNITNSASELPATTIGVASYKNMYKGCEKMTTTPDALPATSVAESCYEGMFDGDSLVVRIPTLAPSTTTAKAAYKNMFKGCQSLVSDNMPSTLLNYNAVGESFYEGMFDGCSSIAKAEFALPAGGLAKACYKNMFRGCSSLTTVPTFGTPWNLYESCYEGMFEGCSSLVTAPSIAWTTNANVASFKNMFKGCSALRNNIPTEMSSKLANSCYESMFEGCESMTTAPTLPTSNLADSCYMAMFKGCKSLPNAPELPARDMEESCYESMFEGCESLVEAPEVYHAQQYNEFALAEACWKNMFKGCTSLQSEFGLISKALKASCFEGMFENCTSLTKAPTLSQEALADRCYYRMFAGCTNLKAAPELPAKSDALCDSCYAYMFNGCRNLHYMDVAFRDWHEDLGATYFWVENVASSGTFMCPAELDKIKDESHIPYGWSAEDNGDYLCFTITHKPNSTYGSITLKKVGTPCPISVKYSYNKKDWFTADLGSSQNFLNSGSEEVVYVKIGDRLNKDANNYWHFEISGDGVQSVSVSGNIMSLYDLTMEETSVPDYAFYKLFEGCELLTDASELKLPAVELGAYAYANMFEGCTGLQKYETVSPNLPATTIGEYCYQDLFKGWTALTEVPAILPAKTLAEGCYSSMFEGDTLLTTAPAMPATTLVANCYDKMFSGCKHLNYLNVSFTSWLDGATDDWVDGVANEGTIECPWALCQSATNKWGLEHAYGASRIPKNINYPWIILIHTEMEFSYKTGELTISGGSPIYWSTDETLSLDNLSVGTLVNESSAVVDCNEWLKGTCTDLDSITYYAMAGQVVYNSTTGKAVVQPTVNSLTIYRYPKKIGMCIVDTEARMEKAIYYANKVSSIDYPVELFISDNVYDIEDKTYEVGEYVSLIGESLDKTIIKSSAPEGAFRITGKGAYLQDMKMENTGSGVAFTNKSTDVTLHVAFAGSYAEAPGGLERKLTILPEPWDKNTDPTQAVVDKVTLNGTTFSVVSSATRFLVRIEGTNKYSYSDKKDFFIFENLDASKVIVRAANDRGAFGLPVCPEVVEPDGDLYNGLSVKLNGYGFTSFSFDAPGIDQLQVVGASVYKGVYHEGAVYLTRLNDYDVVPKGVGVLIVGQPNAKIELRKSHLSVDTNPYADVQSPSVPLYGNCNETIKRHEGDGKYYYGLSGNQFFKLAANGIIPANKAFFDLSSLGLEASSIRIVFGWWDDEEEEEVVSGISYLADDASQNDGYTLTGVKVQENAKGLVVKDRKVILVK